MRTLPATRPRIASEQVTGGITRIIQGVFGIGAPTALAETIEGTESAAYLYHEGDVFLPGAGNFVFEPNFELPLQTVWGNGILIAANRWPEFQPPQIMIQPSVPVAGLGGIEAGTFEFTPLSPNQINEQMPAY